MNRFLHGLARAVAGAFDLPAPVLEIGSYQVEGQEHIADLRSLFPGKEYVGTDFRAGPGVDRVENVAIRRRWMKLSSLRSASPTIRKRRLKSPLR